MASSSSARQTLSTNLIACLGQDDRTDLHLLGSDGLRVPAFRTILACQSSVLHKMLYGNFEESKSDVVKLGYSGDVLKALVDFCITDDVLLFNGRMDENAARDIVQLIACAHFLNMPHLQDKAQNLVDALLEAHKSLAGIIYDEASICGEPTESVKEGALAVVKEYPEETLLSNPHSLRPAVLSELISDDGMMCEEIILFRVLEKWATAEIEVGTTRVDDTVEDRVSIAKDLAAEHIRFTSIQPTDLIGTVKESCIVDEKMIFEALASQAVSAEKELGARFSKERKHKLRSGITVSCAGSAVINGFYEEVAMHKGYPTYRKTWEWQGMKGYPTYRKKCEWQGMKREFVIYRYGDKTWYIAVVAEDGTIGKTVNDFYSGGSQEDSVTSDWWQVATIGKAPVPVCQKS
eukprot:CAMPEP_0183758066 /NCGR_PEP_ID=MMETSP0739-20130205/6153_1 /TAXON_ID=385413 /ORGANISM="Thalassiosira miniscula, Strain CCMP1093" /LENGTH=405 /DNA_ID=CAMNT_0025995597 /DNA_START=350 /DNA_END=1567 /DNA_ORIENTATION=+